MARRSRKMYKQVSNVHIETINDSDWSSFLVYQKQDDSMTSAYIDKVRISWVIDSDEGADAAGAGFLFCASTDQALESSDTEADDNSGRIIAASGTRGGGGTVTLPIKRRITLNYDGTSSSVISSMLESMFGAPIYLHTYASDTGAAKNLYLIVETWGRWFKATNL